MEQRAVRILGAVGTALAEGTGGKRRICGRHGAVRRQGNICGAGKRNAVVRRGCGESGWKYRDTGYNRVRGSRRHTSGTAASGEGAGETLPRQNEADGETGIPSDGAGGQGGEAGLPAGENGGGTGGNASEGAPEDGSGETQPTAGEAAPKSFTDVDESYFDDAVFIGDSRTVGLHDYSGLDNATFYASVGLSVYDMWTDAFCEVDGKKITLEEALLARQFKKVYFQIGINEMGRGTVDGFITAYSQSVQKLKELQPDAVIYVQAIMRVAKEKSDSDPIFNNKGINERNARIAQLADSRTVFYIDVNEVVCDQEGNLRDELTFDNLHLLGSKYDIWVSFLKTKGIL